MYDCIFAEEDVALPRADYHSTILNRAKAEQTIAPRNYFPEIWVWSDGATRYSCKILFFNKKIHQYH